MVASAASAPALASSEVDCRAIGRDPLQIELTDLPSEMRHVAMHAGETLRFVFQGEPGRLGTLALVEGPGAPRMLLVGPAGTEALFTAQRSGAFGFQFTADGAEGARFAASCSPSRKAHSDEAPAHASAPQHGDHAIDPSSTLEGALEMGAQDDVVMSAVVESELPPITAPREAGVTVAAPKSTAATQMKLQWLDRRYRPGGADGPQIDPNASGVKIGVNYKLKTAVTIGALAQVDPAQDMLLGGQHSFLDPGWMAGPVAAVQLAPGLVLDARAAWGEGGGGPDEAAAEAAQRRLVSARLAAQQAFGAWRFMPSVSFNYLQETLPSIVPVAEAATTPAGAGRIDVGPELSYRMDLGSRTFVEPRAVVGGFWDFDSLEKGAPGAPGHAEMRFKAQAGMTVGVPGGPKLEALGGLETGDRETPDAWTGRLQLSVPLK